MQSNRLPLTPDLLSERLTRLRSDFPDLFTAEGSLDKDALATLTSEKPDHREHYRFDWAGKHESKRLAFTPSSARLQYDESRSVNPDNAKGNMIIEGDNLEVLKLLTSAYRGAVKCIYIDPPYNTGKDFVYSDNYTEGRTAYWDKSGQVEDGVRIDTNSESAGRYHSDWLSMMHSRLLLARGLLRDDGVIFVSIDDHEVHNLRKLMDEVFGEENFVACFPWKKRTAKSDVPFGISQDYEWTICYAKEHFNAGIEHTRKYYQTDDYVNDKWRLSDLTKQTTAEERPNSAFDLVDPKTKKVYKFNPKRTWSITNETLDAYYKKGKIVFPDDYEFLNITIPAYRVFESEDKMKAIQKYGSEEILKAVSTFLPKEVGMSEDGNEDIIKIFGGKIFSFPKPVTLIKHYLKAINDEQAIILDFFAGSGTTGQAVMELNREDGGNRQYILVQLPELTDEKSEAYKAGYKRISDITIERNRRVIERMEGDKPGFRVLTLARSAFPRVDFISDPDRTEEENLALLDDYIARKEAVFNLETHVPGVMEEVLLKNGFRLDYTLIPVVKITTNLVYLATDSTGLSAYITLDRPIRSETISYFQSHTEQRFICLEQSLDTTAKWNLRSALGELFVAY